MGQEEIILLGATIDMDIKEFMKQECLTKAPGFGL